MNTPYVSLPNAFRRDMREGKTLIGCWVSLTSHVTAEIIGYAGFDWLLIDGEHAPNDLQTFIAQLQALKDSSSAPVVRPQTLDPVLIKRLLDSGFHNFLMPFVESEEQARLAVAATRYPPQGIRGIGGAHRSNRYGYITDYFTQINDNISVMVQIESREGVANVEKIAAVDGIDGLFIGPSDLAAGFGHFGNPGHPDVQQAMQQVLKGAQAHGKPVGILATAESDARRYMEMGMSIVAVGVDVALLKTASRALCDRFKTDKPD